MTGRVLVYGKLSVGLLGMLLAMPHASGVVLRQSGPSDPPVIVAKTSASKKAAAKKAGTSATATAKAATGAKAKKRAVAAKGTAKGTRIARKAAAAGPTKQTIKLKSAFVASAQLRPMAQQLASTRSPAAYAGVLNYAKEHPGEGAAAAYLALGHTYALDHRYTEAVANYRLASGSGDALNDYADYLAAQAALQAGQGAQAER